MASYEAIENKHKNHLLKFPTLRFNEEIINPHLNAKELSKYHTGVYKFIAYQIAYNTILYYIFLNSSNTESLLIVSDHILIAIKNDIILYASIMVNKNISEAEKGGGYDKKIYKQKLISDKSEKDVIINKMIYDEEIRKNQLRQQQILQQQILQEQILQEQILQEQIRQEDIRKTQIWHEEMLQDRLRQEQIRQEQIRQEQIQEQIRQDRLRQEQIRQEQIRQEQIQEQIRQDRLRQEQMLQDRLRQKQIHITKQIEIKIEDEKIRKSRLEKPDNTEKELCAICLENYVLPSVITKCGHMYCTTCIRVMCDSEIAKCPKCKITFAISDIIRIFI